MQTIVQIAERTFPHSNPNDRGDKVRRAALEFKMAAFAGAPEAPCFWCDSPVIWRRATADHVRARCKGGASDASNLVISCWKCNVCRGVVNALAGRLRDIYQNRRRLPVGERKSMLIALLKERDSLLDDLLELEAMYHRKLTGRRLRDCLRELDEVLKAELK